MKDLDKLGRESSKASINQKMKDWHIQFHTAGIKIVCKGPVNSCSGQKLSGMIC